MAQEITNLAKESSGSLPKLDDGEAYMAAELALLSERLGEKLANKIQQFAFRHANRETDRATYQAMEAFVLSLIHISFQKRIVEKFLNSASLCLWPQTCSLGNMR